MVVVWVSVLEGLCMEERSVLPYLVLLGSSGEFGPWSLMGKLKSLGVCPVLVSEHQKLSSFFGHVFPP